MMSNEYFHVGMKKKKKVDKDKPQNRVSGTEFRIHTSFQGALKYVFQTCP